MTTTFTWTATRPFARAQCIAPYDGALIVPCFNGTTIYESGGAVLTALHAHGAPFSVGAVAGWAAITLDSNGDAWVLPVNGTNILHLPAAGPNGYHVIDVSAKPAWTGITAIGTAVYALSTDGTLYSVSPSAISPVTGGTFGHETLALSTDGTKLYTLLPTLSELGVFASGATSTVATPMANPSCLSGNAAGVAVGGWNPSTITQGTNAFSGSPVSPTTTAVAISTTSNDVFVVSGTDPVWAITQTVTGSGAPSALTWAPNGTQVLVADKTNGKLQVYGLSGFTLSAGTLLSIAGVSSVACTPDSLQGVSTQPASNQLQVLANTLGVWSLGATIADTNGPQVIINLSQTEMVYGITGGITFLDFITSAWTVGTRVTGFGFTVTELATDGAGNIFAVGTSGGTGFLTVASKTGGILASTNWTGSADSVIWNQGQIFVVDSTSSLVRSFGFYAGALHTEQTVATPTGCKGIAIAGQSVWLSGSASLAQFQQTAPYMLAPTAVGEISIYASSAWSSAVLPVGKKPSAVTWDGSGNVWAATEQNDIYEISAAGSILSHTVVADFAGHIAGTPMGFSSLIWNGGHLYAATSLCGALVEIQ